MVKRKVNYRESVFVGAKFKMSLGMAVCGLFTMGASGEEVSSSMYMRESVMKGNEVPAMITGGVSSEIIDDSAQKQVRVTKAVGVVGASDCTRDFGGRCYPVVVSASFGQKFGKYVYALNLSAKVSMSDDIDGSLIYAESSSGVFERIVYSSRGWVSGSECGATLQEQVKQCYTKRGEQVELNRELTNVQLADVDLLIKYAAVKDGVVIEGGYSYQCTRFAGAAFCLPI